MLEIRNYKGITSKPFNFILNEYYTGVATLNLGTLLSTGRIFIKKN